MKIKYNGKHAAVSVTVAGRSLSANRGDVLDVPAEVAKALSVLPGWESIVAPKPQADDTEEV